MPPATVQACPAGFCAPHALGCATNASQRVKARWIRASSALGWGSVKSNHCGRTRSCAKATLTHSLLAGGICASMAAQIACVVPLSRTTLNRAWPCTGQALINWSSTRLNCPRQYTVTHSASPGLIATRASKNGARTTRSTGACPGTVISRLQTCSPLSTRAETGTVWV